MPEWPAYDVGMVYPTALHRLFCKEFCGRSGVDGFIVSDCGAPEHFIHKHAIAKTPAEAAALAIRAG